MQLRDTLPQYINADDELNFIDLWRVLAKRKWFIFASVIIAFAGAVAYLVFTPAVYQSRAVVRVGTIGENGPLLEPLDQLTWRLKKDYSHDDEGMKSPRLAQVEVGNNTHVVEMVAEADSASKARQFLEEKIRTLLADHGRIQKEVLLEQRLKTQLLSQQIDVLRDGIAELPALGGARKSAIDGLAAIERSRLIVELLKLQREKLDTELNLEKVESRPTSLVFGPSLPKTQAKPQPKSVLVIALGIGLLTGLMAAFAVEFVFNFRQRITQTAEV